jgi:hypothetical protein
MPTLVVRRFAKAFHLKSIIKVAQENVELVYRIQYDLPLESLPDETIAQPGGHYVL